jgi:hypothetical protein
VPTKSGFLKDFFKKVQRTGNSRSEEARHRLFQRPARDDVFHAFRLILGREPENDEDIDAHVDIPTVAQLRLVMLASNEFKEKYRVLHPDVLEHPNLNRERRTVVLLHFQKTGGTTLRKLLDSNFPADRRCPILEDKLHVLSAAELGRYDFFAGHFDLSAVRLIPRDAIDIIALFREPSARLISLYRFMKSHPVGDEFASNQLVQLAHRLTAEQFFERPELRDFSEINNHYLFALARSYVWFDRNRGQLSGPLMESLQKEAKSKINGLMAIGLTERFERSVRLVNHVLGFGPTPHIENFNVTDRLTEIDARFRRVEPVENTARLENAMSDLIQHDREIYEFACQEFEMRYARAFSMECAEKTDALGS